MSVHRGHQGDRPCRWVNTATTWQFELDDLVNGLCSEFWRHRCEDDDPLPEKLSARKIITIAREAHERYGTNAVWTWNEANDAIDGEEAQEWATKMILAVMPDLAIPKKV